MLPYAVNLKGQARKLRKNLTESESALWTRLRGKQLLGIQFYRQKPIGQYIVDFFAPRARLVVEVDGSQHMEENHLQKNKTRDEYLRGLGLKVLRFNSRAILTEPDGVVEVIYRTMAEQLNQGIPSSLPSTKSPRSPLSKGNGGILTKGETKEFLRGG